MDVKLSESKGILGVFKPHRDKEYYAQLKQVQPDLSRMTYNELKVATMRAFTTINSLDGKLGSSEYREAYQDLVGAEGFRRTQSIHQCTQGNPITILDQDMNRLPKINNSK
ncbi:unnamed protein product [Echinostoma caproni]|uniref:DNA_pol3_finger domain-containing protein n=1 Tax=Echinostoma caproni TaxID=27848 RepID=A0A183A4Z0_9TREM|nr:unnamed protein product [Echinostoma caproni]